VYLFQRNWNAPEDGRYAQLREEWGEQANTNMFLFFQFQAFLAVLLSLPFLLISFNPEPAIQLVEIIGIGVWTIGFAGETLADAQLKRFKSKPENKGKVCDVGLWFYSRHPNYFFEWVICLAYFLIALAAPYGWLSIISPLLMLHFLKNVTGIPATEEQILKSRGEPYKIYQKTTSSFILWFKKSLNNR
jgi:steroid 5-alpha reductase family enzyme